MFLWLDPKQNTKKLKPTKNIKPQIIKQNFDDPYICITSFILKLLLRIITHMKMATNDALNNNQIFPILFQDRLSGH
jgi:hypothetical protein